MNAQKTKLIKKLREQSPELLIPELSWDIISASKEKQVPHPWRCCRNGETFMDHSALPNESSIKWNNNRNKLRLLYLLRYLMENTDSEHPDRPEADQNFEDVFKRKTEQAPEFFAARVKVCTSPTFFRWAFGFGGKIRITGPEDVSEQYRGMLLRALGETGIGESPGCGDERF